MAMDLSKSYDFFKPDNEKQKRECWRISWKGSP